MLSSISQCRRGCTQTLSVALARLGSWSFKRSIVHCAEKGAFQGFRFRGTSWALFFGVLGTGVFRVGVTDGVCSGFGSFATEAAIIFGESCGAAVHVSGILFKHEPGVKSITGIRGTPP